LFSRPLVTYSYESDYAEPTISASSAEGQAMLVASTPETPVFRCPGNRLADVDPLYTPSRGETCSASGMDFGKLVRRTSDFDKFQTHIDRQSEQLLKWTAAQRDQKKRVSLADATLMSCLGPSAQAVVRQLLWGGDVSGAWEALSEKYAPAQDSDVIQQLTQHVKSLRMKAPTRLEEYLGSLDTLQDALEASEARIGEHELLAIVKGAVLDSAKGRAAYGTSFTNARQLHWSLERLTSVLISDCHELVQAAGIASLKDAEFREEMRLRRISQPADNPRTDPKVGGVAPFAGAVTAGIDWKTYDTTKCYKCEDYGHISRHCPKKHFKAAAAATPTETGAPEADASDAQEKGASEDGGRGKTTSGQAKPMASAASSRRTSASSGFFREVDDEYASESSCENDGATACQSSADDLVLFSNGMGDPQRRA
jgi:hypothetical protein